MPAAIGQAAVLFDLDGTLTDPFVGISRSMKYALDTLGYPCPEPDALRTYIGPPLQVTFPKLLARDDPALVAEALRLYRERYADVGKFENVLIPGIPEAVAALAQDGYFLAVATSKLETYAREIVEHFGLLQHFSEVHGSQLDGSRADKSALVAHIVGAEALDAARTVMIGDRLHDIAGAISNRVASIGVLWGFGDRHELETAGAGWIADVPEQLVAQVAEAMRLRAD